MVSRVVIVGGGQAALQAAVTLRQRNFEGSLTMICEELALPYQRPPLSKGYLLEEPGPERLAFRSPGFYEKLGIAARVGVRAAAVDRGGRRLELSDGSALAYDALVLATGARPQRLGLPGEGPERFHVLRTAADADGLRGRLRPGARLVIVGGGYLGLEVAAAATRSGARVTVLEALPRVLSRVTGSRIAEFLTAAHRSHGVEVLTDSVAREFLSDPAGGVRVVLAGGGELACDEVLVAVGVVPVVELAEACGLRCENGIVVDEHGRTEDAAIFAAGDCTNHPNPLLGRRLRLESVHNAVEQAKAVAAAIAGSPEPYSQVPWFYSDQYEIKLQTVGLFQGADRELVLGAPERGEFSVLYLAGERVVAVDAVNHPRSFVLGRKLLGQAADGTVPLAEWPDAGGDAESSAPVTMPA